MATIFVAATLTPVASVELTPSSATIPLGPLGGTVRLTALLRDAAGNVVRSRQIAWSSSNPAVATVTGGSGGRALITGVSPGAATITATSEGRSAAATITLMRPGPYVRLSVGGPDYYGGAHTCGVTSDGWVLCWGTNRYGALGNAVPGFTYAPMGIGGMTFSEVSASLIRTCAVTSTGAAFCWGDAGVGALGLGTISGPDQCFNGSRCSEVPVAVSGGLQFVTLGLGGEHACALTGGGIAYCWGYNDGGLLGEGIVDGPADCVTDDGRNGPCSTVPVAVVGGLHFTALAVGGDISYHGEHTCGLTTDGTAYCWGYNPFGQLGDGTTTNRASPTRVAGGMSFVALSVGNGHTCGLTTDGSAYCWGLNYQGQLGIGTSTGPEGCEFNPFSGTSPDPCSTVPVPVAGATQWAGISAGAYHTCGVALGGLAFCWGDNSLGQLGDGTTGSTAEPTAVSAGITFAHLSAGYLHTCGVAVAGIAYCWGDNNGGELGNGSTSPSLVPVKVAGQP